MDEVEERQAMMTAASIMDKITDPAIKSAVLLLLQIVSSHNERITELQLTDEC